MAEDQTADQVRRYAATEEGDREQRLGEIRGGGATNEIATAPGPFISHASIMDMRDCPRPAVVRALHPKVCLCLTPAGGDIRRRPVRSDTCPRYDSVQLRSPTPAQ